MSSVARNGGLGIIQRRNWVQRCVLATQWDLGDQRITLAHRHPADVALGLFPSQQTATGADEAQFFALVPFARPVPPGQAVCISLAARPIATLFPEAIFMQDRVIQVPTI